MSNNNNNNNNTNNTNTIKEETRILRSFVEIFRSKVDSIVDSGRLTQIFDGIDAEEYKAEQIIIHNITTPGIMWGVGAGIASFVFLRKAPGMFSRYYWTKQRKSFGGGGSGYKFDDVARQYRQTNTTNPFRKSDSNDGIPKPQGSVVARTIKFVLDVGLSMLTATAVAVYVTDALEGVASIPLVEGRSILAEEVCDDCIKQYKSIPKEFWKKDHSNYPSLDYIEMFVKNCQKRRKYERQLREERGLQRSNPVSIPSPGVPADLDVEEEEEYEGEKEENVYFEHFEKEDVETDDGYVGEWSSFDDFENDKKSNKGGGKSPKPRWGY